MGHRALTLVVLLLAAAAAGGEIRGTVRIRAADGGVEPTADLPIVVYLTGFRQPPLPDSPVISQKDKNFAPDVLLPGITINTSADDYFAFDKMQLAKFNGTTYDLFPE